MVIFFTSAFYSTCSVFLAEKDEFRAESSEESVLKESARLNDSIDALLSINLFIKMIKTLFATISTLAQTASVKEEPHVSFSLMQFK
jgi:hypothetical protein